MHILLRFIYIVVSYLLIPVILLYLFWKGFGNPDYRRRIPERFGFYRLAAARDVVWVHAASVGEVQAAAALINALLERYPQATLLVTTITPTGSDRVRALFGERVMHCYAPFDLHWPVKAFFNRFAPRVAIIMETELWPNLYRECGARNVPLVLASARLSEKSVSGYRKLAALFRKTLSHDIVIAAQTQLDADRFIDIGANPERVQVTGNIKYDFELAPGVREQGQELRQRQAPGRPVWVAASTHADEEQICLAAQHLVLKQQPDALLLLVPRHPERFDGIAALIESDGLDFVRRSGGEACSADTRVMLGDTMGELMVFYAASDVAFVGGSLANIGGHNLLEPAALELPIVSGPHTYNAPDIARLLDEGGALLTVTDEVTLARAVLELFEQPDERSRRGKNAAALIEENRGALERVLKLIQPLLA